ncbi:site-specific DNA-methyltransferase [Candidatus Thorarchaeota archaeon]|nr:MAG: site-specific DNA-methyltransferase [Candidatus Thorarchaeota archaeon]
MIRIVSSILIMSSWKNKIFLGDCLEAIESLGTELQSKIKAIYIDPPFFSGQDYTIKKKGVASGKNAASLTEYDSYSDVWDGGLEAYLSFMNERIEAMKPLLTEDGSFWLHLDSHVMHYAKVMLDRIFGYENFVNQIIWKRTNSPKAQSHGFGSQHDVILLYANNAEEFEAKIIYRPHDKRALRPYSYEDERGRFRLIEIEAHGIQRTQNRKQFEWRGRTAPYLYRKETLDKWWNEGIIYTSRNGRYSKKQYLADVKGIPVSDLWLDIPPVQGASAEYTGFTTQKPRALLKRIIESSTDEEDIIADFFVGSGTTAVAAELMKRRWVVSDISELAIDILQKQLLDIQNSDDEKDSPWMYEIVDS